MPVHDTAVGPAGNDGTLWQACASLPKDQRVAVRRTTMAELEERLHRHADDAPSAHDLAPAARARLRSRRTARAVVAAVAALVVAVPLGVQALTGHGPDAAPPVTVPKVHRPPADGFSPAPAGWRWETGNGLQALVPDTWGYGVDLTGTCNRQVEPGVPGAVEVPGTWCASATRRAGGPMS